MSKADALQVTIDQLRILAMDEVEEDVSGMLTGTFSQREIVWF